MRTGTGLALTHLKAKPSAVPRSFAAILAVSLLAACSDLGVQNAWESLPERPAPILVSVSDRVRDTSSAVQEMLAASDHPMGVIQWLENDTARTGYQKGMLVDVEADWPAFTAHFRAPAHYEGVHPYPPLAMGRYRVGFFSLVNDGDGDGHISGLGEGFPDAGPFDDSLPDSLEVRFGAFVNAAVTADQACPTRACKDTLIAALDSMEADLDSRAREVGYRVSGGGDAPRDWYLGKANAMLVVYIPDAYSLGVANMRLQGECGNGARFHLGYNFKPLKRPFPRYDTLPIVDIPTSLFAGALVEDPRDREISVECSEFIGLSVEFSDRIFRNQPPLFEERAWFL